MQQGRCERRSSRAAASCFTAPRPAPAPRYDLPSENLPFLPSNPKKKWSFSELRKFIPKKVSYRRVDFLRKFRSRGKLQTFLRAGLYCSGLASACMPRHTRPGKCVALVNFHRLALARCSYGVTGSQAGYSTEEISDDSSLEFHGSQHSQESS